MASQFSLPRWLAGFQACVKEKPSMARTKYKRNRKTRRTGKGLGKAPKFGIIQRHQNVTKPSNYLVPIRLSAPVAVAQRMRELVLRVQYDDTTSPRMKLDLSIESDRAYWLGNGDDDGVIGIVIVQKRLEADDFTY